MTTRQRAFHYCEDTAAIPALLRGAVVAIGNFDGFHRGHQRVMRTLLGMAKQRNRPAIVLTFEPHPRDFFALGEPLFRLTDRTSKRMLAKAMGLDGLVVLDFDQALSEIEPEDFVRRILVENLACSSVVVGEKLSLWPAATGRYRPTPANGCRAWICSRGRFAGTRLP